MARQIRATQGRELGIKDQEIPWVLGEQRQRVTCVRRLGNLRGGPAQVQQLTEGRAVELAIINDEYRWMHIQVSLWRRHCVVAPIYRRSPRRDAGTSLCASMATRPMAMRTG